MSVPLDQPHYGIGPAGMVRFLRKYATFRGRASRSEFWWGQLTLFLVSSVLTAPGLVLYALGTIELVVEMVESPATAATSDAGVDLLVAGFGLLLLGSVLNLAFLVPHLALTWRRLQDTGLHGGLAFAFICGGWALGTVVPFAGYASLVPGFLSSSLRSAWFESAEAPVLPTTIDPATWHLTRAWVRAGAAGAAPQPWAGPQQWQAAQPWQQQPWQQQAWPQQPWSQATWQQQPHQQASPDVGPSADPQR